MRGLVPPNDFIPIAEATGLMIPIGDWVLRSARVQLARWQANPASAGVTLAVNVSATRFAEPDFVQRVLEIALGQSLGLDVIAEGVETSEHCRFLADMGCTSYQGSYFARPLPSAEFDAFVAGALPVAAPAPASPASPSSPSSPSTPSSMPVPA